MSLEQFLHYHHHPVKRAPTVGVMILADGPHNLIGGVAVGGAFGVDIRPWGYHLARGSRARRDPPKNSETPGSGAQRVDPRRALIYNLLSAITFLPHRRAHRLQPSPGSSPSPWPSPSPRATSAKSPPLISSLEIREILYTACFGLGPLAPLGIAPSRDATNPQGKMHPCRWVSGINAGAVVARSGSNSPFSGHSALLAIAAPGIHTERRWGEKRGS